MKTVFRSVFVAVLLMRPNVASAADSLSNLRVHLIGEESVAARVTIVGSDNKPYAPENSLRRTTKRGDTYFYADGDFDVSLPQGTSHMMFSGGIESVPQNVVYDSSQSKDHEVTVQMRRWIDMSTRGWYSGDSHVHLRTGGPLNLTVADALVAARAEGVHFVNLCVSNNVGDDVLDAHLITGKPHKLSTQKHLLVFGEEMRSSIYGHMQFFGIKKLVEPQYTGFDNTPNHHDYPANFTMAAEAVNQGGLVTYAHPMFADQPVPFPSDLTAANGAARELPVDAILGVVHAVDLMCYNSDEDLSAELWYRLLNCGIKLSACVGTDALLDRFTDPMGGSRVYVKVDGPLTMQSWLAGLKAGHTFVTNGPMANLQVNGKGPGESVSLKAAGSVSIGVAVESILPIGQIEVVVNGEVAHRKTLAELGDSAVSAYHFRHELPISNSSWIALRVRGPDHPQVFDGPLWAHTSPVFVRITDQPIASAVDAAYFVDWIDRLLRVVATRDRYATSDDSQEITTLFQKAQDRFRKMADQGS